MEQIKNRVIIIVNILIAVVSVVLYIVTVSIFHFSTKGEYVYFFLMALLIAVIPCYFARHYWKDKIEKTAFMMVILWGCLLWLVFPIGTSTPDEVIHLRCAYEWSNQILGTSTIDQTYSSGYPILTLRSSDCCFQDQLDRNNLESAYNEMCSQGIFVREYHYIQTESYEPIYPVYKYFFATAGVLLARLLNLSLSCIRLFGCMFNLLFYAICVYFAVKIIPKGKTELMFFTLLPTMLIQCKSFSYDAVSNGIAILFIALCAWMTYFPGRTKWKHFFVAVILYAYLQLFKGIYLGFIFMLLYAGFVYIKFRRLGDKNDKNPRKKYISIFCITIVGVLCLYKVCPFVYEKICLVLSSRKYNGVNGLCVYSLNDCINHPKLMLTVVYNSIQQGVSNFVVGNNSFPYFDTGNAIVTYGILIISIVLILKERGYRYPKGFRICALASTISMVAFAIIGCIFAWTPYGDTVVWGMQSRYFLPGVMLTLIAYGSTEHKSKRHFYILYIMNILLVFYTAEVLITHF